MLDLILLGAFHVILIFGFVILIQFSDNFNYCIRALLVCCVLQALTIVFQVGTPVGLLYGPVLYLSGQASRGSPDRRTNSFHFIPFFVFMAMYSGLFWRINTQAVWASWFFSIYYPSYFAAMALSLTLYPVVMLFQKKSRKHTDPSEESLLIQLSSLQLILAVLIAVLFAGMLRRINFAYPPQILTYAILCICIIIVIRHLYHSQDKKGDLDASLEGIVPVEAGLEPYAEKIHKYLAETRIYLRPNLSLEMLARETGIPKGIFSEVLNTHIGKNFYQLTAAYRIRYALELLKRENHNFTIEALAYECGFNSKSSFNRYFKEYTGSRPSEYRSKLAV